MQPTILNRPAFACNNVFLLSFFAFFFIFSFDDFSVPEAAKERNFAINRVRPESQIPLTLENIRLELDAQHIICPEQVYAQIMIESGRLGSFLCERTNNLLGMRYPGKRESVAIGVFLPEQNLVIKGTKKELKKYRSRNQYAVYACWQDCIRDYKNWQDQCFRLTDRYLAFIGTYYADDTAYVAKIKQITK